MRLLSIDVGIKNMGLCLLETSEVSYTIEFWERLSLFGEPKACERCTCKGGFTTHRYPGLYFCKKHRPADSKAVAAGNRRPSQFQIAKNLYEFLGSLSLGRIDAVIIEDQRESAPDILALSHFLFYHFTSISEIKEVSYAPAKSKYKGCPRGLCYAERKKQMIRKARELLEGTSYLAVLEANQKKDDMADALMQAVSYFGLDLCELRDPKKKE